MRRKKNWRLHRDGVRCNPLRTSAHGSEDGSSSMTWRAFLTSLRLSGRSLFTACWALLVGFTSGSGWTLGFQPKVYCLYYYISPLDCLSTTKMFPLCFHLLVVEHRILVNSESSIAVWFSRQTSHHLKQGISECITSTSS